MHEVRLLDLGQVAHGNRAMPDRQMGAAFDIPTQLGHGMIFNRQAAIKVDGLQKGFWQPAVLTQTSEAVSTDWTSNPSTYSPGDSGDCGSLSKT
jgi:hypothetical protein